MLLLRRRRTAPPTFRRRRLCLDSSNALPPKTDVQNEEEGSAKLLHNKLTLVDTNKVAGNTIMTFFDSDATGQMPSGFKFAEHSPMAKARRASLRFTTR
eukprot:6488301-Prymnesium_polylepis.1